MRYPAVPVLAATVLIASLSTPASGQSVRHDPGQARVERALWSSDRLADLVVALEADHFEVRRGSMFQPPVVDLACAGLLASCNGNNATNPYMVASVPPVGYAWSEDPPLGFMMRPDEAIVLVGQTPPPVTYFSYRSFVFSRFLEKESVHRPLFVSLGDPDNMLTLQTRDGGQGDPYDRAFVLVAAADKGTQERVLAALSAAKYPKSIINLDVISPNLAHLGLDTEQDDELVLLHRLALWKPGFEQAGREYMAHPPVAVLRVTPTTPLAPAELQPLPVEKLRPRGTGRTEMDFTPEVEALRRAILAEYPDWQADELTPAVWLEESFPAMQRGVDVLGESRDTIYLRTEETFNLGEDDFLVVYGTNHEATGKATYANFTVYDPCKACGIAGESTRRLAGSALDYVGGSNSDVPHVDQLYAWKVARDCGGDPRCTTVPAGTCPGMSNENGQFLHRLPRVRRAGHEDRACLHRGDLRPCHPLHAHRPGDHRGTSGARAGHERRRDGDHHLQGGASGGRGRLVDRHTVVGPRLCGSRTGERRGRGRQRRGAGHRDAAAGTEDGHERPARRHRCQRTPRQAADGAADLLLEVAAATELRCRFGAGLEVIGKLILPRGAPNILKPGTAACPAAKVPVAGAPASRVSVFPNVVPSNDSRGRLQARRLEQDSGTCTDVAVISAEDLSCLARTLPNHSETGKLPLGVLSMTGIFDRATLEERLAVLLR